MLQLISEVFGRAFDNEWLRRGDDGPCCRRPPPASGW
jgi:hydrogenase expression/formation protein HypE